MTHAIDTVFIGAILVPKGNGSLQPHTRRIKRKSVLGQRGETSPNPTRPEIPVLRMPNRYQLPTLADLF
jgi:hypothetical protein